MIDGFLELLKGGKAAISGENLDATFEPKHAMAIVGFNLSSTSRSSRRQAERLSEGIQEGAAPVGGTRPSGDSEDGEGRRFALNFEVTKQVDQASPALFRAYCKHACLPPDHENNAPFDVAKVTLRKAGGASAEGKPAPLEYLILQFTKVFVASYEIDGGGGDKLPTETISFTFKTMSLLYRPQKIKGSGATRQTAWNFENPAPKV